MRLCCGSASYQPMFQAEEMTIFDWMTHCAKDLGVGAIEIGVDQLVEADEEFLLMVKRVAVDLQLTIASVKGAGDFGLSDDEKRVKELETMESNLIVARHLGAPLMRVTAGFPDYNLGEQWAEMVRCLEISALLAEREGIVLAVENAPQGGFIRGVEDIDRLTRGVETEWFRLNLAPKHFDDFEEIEKSMLYTVIVRATLDAVGPDGGDGEFDYPRFIAMLRDLNYRGHIVVEHEGEESALTAVPRCIQYLRRLINEKG